MLGRTVTDVNKIPSPAMTSPTGAQTTNSGSATATTRELLSSYAKGPSSSSKCLVEGSLAS
jgi:hypothetical protein